MSTAKTAGELPFWPACYSEISTTFVFDRSRFSPDVLTSILAAAGVNDEVVIERHIGQLMRRQSGELLWQSTYPRLGLEDYRRAGWLWDELVSGFELPFYVWRNGDFEFRWTLDVFNSRNREANIPSYDCNSEYLQVAISFGDFTANAQRPLYLRNVSYEVLMRRHGALNALLRIVYDALRPSYVFGSFKSELWIYCGAFWFATRRVAKRTTFSDYFWPWAIYTCDLGGRMLQVNLDVLEEQRYRNSPHLGLRREEWPGGGVLMYAVAPDYEDGEAELYASTLGLKCLQSIRFKDME